MADTSGQENSQDTGAGTQAEIDALLSAAGGGEAAAPASEPADDGGLSQADIDAAIAVAGGSGDPAVSAQAADSADGAMDPADIDAAVGTAADAAGEAPVADDAPEDQRVDSEGRPFDAAAVAMAAAIEEDKAAAGQDAELAAGAVELPDFEEGPPDEGGALQSIDLLHDVDLRVRIELGRTRMYVEDVLRLGQGSVVELDKLAGDPVDVFVNERLVARGEVLVLNDNFCVRVSEIISDENERALLA